MHGLHLTADLYQCAGDARHMLDAGAIAALCRAQTAMAGLTQVQERWVKFPDHQGQPGGVTGTVLLAESHLAIHTWPEAGCVTIDVYVCNFSADNSGKARALMDGVIAAYVPGRVVRQQLMRGDIGPDAGGGASAGEGDWALETLTPHARFGWRATRREALCTPHQQMELLHTPQFGKVLRLDGRFMTSEGEEFFYHEALVHPAAMAHAAPRRALILGGGDGGAAEELLKHPCMEQVVVAELDAAVVEAARTHLQQVHRGAFDDPRLQLRIGDGMAMVEHSGERFDLVLMDLTDPDTPASALYSDAALARMKRVLAPGGALVLHLGSPVFHAAQVARLSQSLHQRFAIVRCYGLYIPLYGAYWGMAVASDTLDAAAASPALLRQRLAERRLPDLRYYNTEVHPALFALPNYYRDLVQPAQRPRAVRLA
ncbi:polyamine aminopropyltransferase [Delftia sp. PS-11]|uniref:polyamine aminopropyltransferase n=1 Tax=Delftia sp. PS-11 TaxID=2767222 RepID=UPI002455DD66|nr:polyamine aminopropyltransferase [Delftia sp. PS-11]KAJ8742578.1 polyamine aminopropyltransferase [Delftia sp. PS-11]